MRLKSCIGSLLLTLMLCSCNSWLDIDLINQSEESDLFSTERGFSEALAGVYCDIAASNMYGRHYLSECLILCLVFMITLRFRIR